MSHALSPNQFCSHPGRSLILHNPQASSSSSPSLLCTQIPPEPRDIHTNGCFVIPLPEPAPYLVNRQDRSYSYQQQLFHCTPPLRSSFPGISEPTDCLQHSPRFSLPSNHSTLRLPVVRHGSSTEMAYPTPIAAAAHASIFARNADPGLGYRLRPLSFADTETLRSRAGDCSYRP